MDYRLSMLENILSTAPIGLSLFLNCLFLFFRALTQHHIHRIRLFACFLKELVLLDPVPKLLHDRSELGIGSNRVLVIAQSAVFAVLKKRHLNRGVFSV